MFCCGGLRRFAVIHPPYPPPSSRAKPNLRYGMRLVKSEANCVQLNEAASPPPQQPTLSGRVAQLAEQLTLNQ